MTKTMCLTQQCTSELQETLRSSQCANLNTVIKEGSGEAADEGGEQVQL